MANRNITLTMSEELVRQARILAAQRDTSVSGLVAALLEEQLAGDVRDYDAVSARERRLMREGVGLEVGAITWSRDELHDR